MSGLKALKNSINRDYENKERSKPELHQIELKYETITYKYIVSYPTHGLKIISNELKTQGILFSETGIYNVLKRKRLNCRIDWLFYAQKYSNNPVLTERYTKEGRNPYQFFLSRIPVLSRYFLCGHYQGNGYYLSIGG